VRLLIWGADVSSEESGLKEQPVLQQSDLQQLLRGLIEQMTLSTTATRAAAVAFQAIATSISDQTLVNQDLTEALATLIDQNAEMLELLQRDIGEDDQSGVLD